MENYIVSARKYRPTTFADVVGQQSLTNTLKNAIRDNRLAHAYLFTGSRGIGKTSCARIFAKTINCTNRRPDGEACDQCESCREFNAGNSLNVLELDAASHNGVDEIKGIIDQVIMPPVNAAYKVFIIDEVHMLSTAAFNAFLKTLEEPPSYVIFILATTEKHKIIPTILSRCQIYDFSRITVSDIAAHLRKVADKENIKAEPEALNIIARKADGAMRDALSIFDQVAASSEGNITYQATIDNLNILDHSYYNRLMKAFLDKNVPEALLIYKEIRDHGFDSLFFINGLADYLRDLMVASSPSTMPLLEAVDEVKNQLAAIATKFPPSFLYKAMDICNEADLNYRLASNKQFFTELMLIRLCQQLSPFSDTKGKEKGHTLEPIAVTNNVAAPTSAPSPSPDGTSEPKQHNSSASPDTADASNSSTTDVASHPTVSEPSLPASGKFQPHPAGVATAFRRPQFTAAPKSDSQSPSKDNARPETATKQKEEEKPIADSEVARIWHDFIKENQNKPLLVTLMASGLPAREQGNTYVFEVGSEINARTIGEYQESILKYMRERLDSSAFNLKVKVSANSTAAAETMSEREALQAMMEKYPETRKFIEALELKLDN